MPGPASSGPIAVDRTLAYFHDVFAELGVEWCVAGAVAANAYRTPRATTDLDLVVHISAARFTVIAARLQADGWKTFRVSPSAEYPDIVRMGHAEYFPTDLLLVKTEYQAEALRRARVLSVGPQQPRILSAEDVIVHKLIAYRYRDRADVSEILRAGTPLDRSYVERWATEWDVLERWHEAVAEINPGRQ